MSASRGDSCKGTKAIVCTVCFILVWVLLLVPLAMTHMAVAELIPVLEDLPDNVRKGFYQELKFDRLTTDSEAVRDASADALVLCTMTTLECTSGVVWDQTFCMANPAKCNMNQDQTVNYDKIQAAFASSLTVIDKVAGDKYFGQGGLVETKEHLEDIINETAALENVTNCAAATTAYCVIYKASLDLVQGSGDATKEIDKMVDSDMVKEFKDNTDKLALLHALPYAMVISMLFFTCFWYKDAACCCCGGSILGGLAMLIHWLFWLLAVIVCIIIVAIGYGIKERKDEVKMKGFKGEPNMEELLDHISLNYPEFWKIVVTPLEEPLDDIYGAFWLFLFFCILVFLYGCCVCTIKPYKKSAVQQDA